MILQILKIQDSPFVSVNLVKQTGIINVINLKPGTFLLNHEYIFKFLKIEKTLHAYLMFLPISYSLWGKVAFNDIFKRPVISEQTKFYNMVTELFPFHGLIPIDINLLKKVNQGQGQLMFQFLIFLIIIKILKHARYKLIDSKPLLTLLKSLLNHWHFLTMKHLKDLVLSYLLIILLCLLLFFSGDWFMGIVWSLLVLRAACWHLWGWIEGNIK